MFRKILWPLSNQTIINSKDENIL